MKLTKKQASDRTKKGWKKRARKVAGVGAGAYGIAMNRKYVKMHYNWNRANTGEKIKVKGFSPEQMVHARAAFDSVEQNLKADRRVGRHGLSISNTVLLKPGVSGNFAYGRTTFVDDFEKAARKKGIITDDTRKVMRAGAHVGFMAEGRPKRSRVRVSDHTFRHFNDRYTGVIAHELSHAIDEAGGMHSETPNYRRRAGFTKQAKHTSGTKGYADRGNHWTPKFKGDRNAYSSSSPVEHFAESSRVILGHRDPGEMHIVHPNTRKYFNAHVFNKTADPTKKANITKSFGHQHYDKFLVGAVVVGGAGYGGYKYHQYRKEKIKNAETKVQRRRRARVRTHSIAR